MILDGFLEELGVGEGGDAEGGISKLAFDGFIVIGEKVLVVTEVEAGGGEKNAETPEFDRGGSEGAALSEVMQWN